jgi:two-component system, cell cycle sensor histidine kinase and response regulator CckA
MPTGEQNSDDKSKDNALRQYEEAYRSLFEQSADGIIITAHRKIVKANQAFCALCGLPIEQVIGTDPVDAIHPDDQYLAVRAIQTLQTGESVEASHVYRGLREDRSVIWLEVRSMTIEWAGQPAIQSIVREITQRKRTEEALRESEAKFRQVVEYSPLPIAITTEAAMIEYVNPKFIETFGYILEEVTQLADWFRLAHPDPAYRQEVIERWQAFLERAASENRPGEGLEVEITCQDNSVRTFEIYATPMGDKTLALFNDLTERKLAEKALQEANETLRTLIKSSPVAIIAFGVDGDVKLWNPAAEHMFGWSEEEVHGQYLPYVAVGTLEEHEALRECVVQGESLMGVDVRRQRKDGSVIDVSVSAAPLHDAQGKVIGVMSIYLDISDRKRAEKERAKLEAQMREVQKLESLGVLAGGIAHDFNNLLMAILGNADLALIRLSPTSPARRNIEEIARASHRAADLCRQMLAYSGKGRFVIGRYDLSEMVREMEPMIEASISKKAKLRYSFTADLPAVEADVDQMRQVIINLITNASEALGEMNGIISISSGVMECDRAYLAGSFLDDKLPEGSYVCLEVSDTGCGMDAETMSRIFDPFFTTKFVGRGLGLAAVLGIVRGHRGAIKVYSEPGNGTTFKILLPAVDWAPEERALIKEESDPVPVRGCVLLVDDDPDVRFVGSEMLELLGFQVLTAIDGPEGLDVFRTHGNEIDCVILDLTMPNMGGEEAFRELRRLRSDVCVIMSSGYNEQDVTQRFVGKGLAGFIQKPYTAAKLRETLNRVLG